MSIAAVSDAAPVNANYVDEYVDSCVDSCYDECNAQELGLTRSEVRAIVLDVSERSLPHGSAGERSQFLAGLRWNELLLARACARGHEAAWNRFLVLYREKLYSAAAAIAKEDVLARELADSLYADLYGTLLQPDGRRASKLESYLGRGSLEGWLRTVLAQAFVDRFRNQRKFVSFDERIAGNAAVNTTRFNVAGQEHQVAQATDSALAELSPEERFLLAAYYLDGRTLSQIGRLLSVHESTVSRRLDKVIAVLRRRIVAKLRRTGVSKRDAEQMLELDVRDLEVDVRRGLAQERPSGTM